MSTSPYAGHHRASRVAPSPSPRLTRIRRAGLLLPAAAATTLVLTSIGAQHGSISASPADSTAAISAIPSQRQSPTDSRWQTQDVTTSAFAAPSRPVQDRAARDSERQKLDTVAQDVAARTAQEQARQAGAQAQPLAPAPATTLPAAPAAPAAPAPAAPALAAPAPALAARPPAATAPAPTPAKAPAAPAPTPTPAKAPDTQGWVAPIGAGYPLSSGFGMRWGVMHSGQDFAIPVGTEVRAMSSGTVLMAGWSGGFGYKVEIQYWDGTVSWYAHNSSLKVSQGQSVSPGQVVALSGNSGHSTGPHLHLEIHPANGAPVAPLGWLQTMGIVP